MARTAILLRFLIISVIIFVNVETKKSHTIHRPISKRTSAPHAHYPKSSPKPHTYPESFGGSGGGRQVTSAPHLGNAPHSYIRTTTSRTYYPTSTSRSVEWKQVTSAPLLSNTPFPQPKPTTGVHTYPLSFGGSGGGRQVTSAPILSYTPYPQNRSASGAHTYPLSAGGSGGGFKPILDPRTGSFTRPSNTNTGIVNTINVNTVHTSHTGYNNHIYVRNQPATFHTSNIRTTHIYHYDYRPPRRVYYTDYGNQAYYYPVYTGRLPDYVFEYRASRSRYSKLLAGLALYNLGRVSKDSELQTYHSIYQARPDEICIFGVYYNKNRSDEMEVDCRLMTDFILSESKIQPGMANSNAIVLPNGTLVYSYTQIAPSGILNALDPRFNGDYVNVERNMKCYIIWSVSYTITRRKEVECGLLQAYVDNSMNSATKVTSTLLIILASVAVLLFS